MNSSASTFPEMLQCLYAATGNAAATTHLSVLERQRAVLKSQQDHSQLQQLQQQQCYFHELNMMHVPAAQAQSFHGSMTLDGVSGLSDMILNGSSKLDTTLMVQTRWPDFGSRSGFSSTLDVANHTGGGYGVNCAPSRTTSCQPAAANEPVAPVMTGSRDGGVSLSAEKTSVFAGAAGRLSFNKRKPEKSIPPPPKVDDSDEDNRAKKVKACVGEDEIRSADHQQNPSRNKVIHNMKSGDTRTINDKNNKNQNRSNREASGCSSKGDSKVGEVQKPDYIHVRARRGQATDSHSLAERVRREKISERMKYLQDLVPGCNKVAGKAGMLDEIINYVQSLQRQVEFLSMKLAAVNPRLDLNIEDLFAKEVFPACSGVQLPPDIVNPSNLQYNAVQTPMGPLCSSDVGVNPVLNVNLRPSISASTLVHETFPDLSGFNIQQIHSSAASPLETELQNIFAMEFQQATPNSFQQQTCSMGSANEATTLKMEK